MTTIVVNLRREAYDIYIGRGGARPNRVGNPFVIGRDGSRDEVIAKHMEWARQQPWLRDELERMKGKRLGCFCAPEACHGDNYVKLIEELGI